MAKKTPKKRNRAAQDVTLINVRALKKALVDMEKRITATIERELRRIARDLNR
jgi:hypothetical protein